MRAQLRPLVELLEGRMLLSTGNVLIEDGPEHLQFVAPGTNAAGVHAAVSQQAGSVTLTLTLTRSTNVYGVEYKGSVQVEVATGPIPPPYTPAGSAQPEVSSENWALRRGPATSVPPATPGVQYQTVDETITFPPGVNTEPVTIPIVAGAANPGMLSFQVAATQVGVQTNPDGTVPAGLQTTEDVFIAGNTGTPVPRIDGARIVANGHNTSEFVLHFSQPMGPASVDNISGYSFSDLTIHPVGGPFFLGGAARPALPSISGRRCTTRRRTPSTFSWPSPCPPPTVIRSANRLLRATYPSYGPHLDGHGTIPSDQSVSAEGTVPWPNAVANDATPPGRSSGGGRSGISSGAGSRSVTSASDKG